MDEMTTDGPMAGIRCPKCHGTQKFGIQVTMNITMDRDGFDAMGRQPGDDAFADKPVDPMSGLRDADPIVCMNEQGYCRHTGTVETFRLGW